MGNLKSYLEKIMSRPELSDLCKKLKNDGKRIGFTSGVFDLLHAGHVSYLAQAKSQCDVLIVAVNSDRSVRANKGDRRPIVREADRVQLVAALESVSFTFIFDEENNNTNIETLKPDLYIKAGDYSLDKLSSAPLVEKYGGKVVLVSQSEGLSSTGIISRVLDAYGSVEAPPIVVSEGPAKPTAFLDRDGTINEHVDYLSEPSKFKLIPGALEGMKLLQDGGFRLVIVTNQPGIGLGYFHREDLFKINSMLLREADKAGIKLDRVYFCPHSKSQRCGCMKPATGMIDRAKKELPIDFENSFMVGDTTIDVMFGKNAGLRTFLLETGRGGQDGHYDVKPDYRVKDLRTAAEMILKIHSTR